MSNEIYKVFILIGVGTAYVFSIYGFLSFLYHVTINRNKRFAEKDKAEWFRKGFLAGCAETVDLVIKHRFDVENKKEQSK